MSDPDDLRDVILEAMETSLSAQLGAVRRLRSQPPESSADSPQKSMSQVDMAYDILKRARSPLHVSTLIDRIHAAFALRPDRESLVSALTKKVNRGDRFLRTDKNTFALREKL